MPRSLAYVSGVRCALALAVLLIAPTTADARLVAETHSRGEIRAELAYNRSGDEFNESYRDFVLRIHEGEQLVFDERIADCGRRCRRYAPANFGRSRSIAVRDLDGGAHEVVVDFYTGGAYCCWLTTAFRAKDDTYAESSHNWGPKRQRLVQLGGGPPEYLAHDDGFLGPYGCAFCWRFLPHVWRFDEGEFRDVTRRFPGQVRPSSRKLRRRYFRASQRGDDVKPVLAPYVATTYLLGEPRRGWRLVRRALRRGELVNHRGRYDFCPCGDRYPKALRRFLRETGYR
jgi:hypothetical protein